MIEVEPLDVDAHLELIHAWMNTPHVAPWWELDRPRDDVGAYLSELTHQQGWIVSADGVPFGYVETYRVAGDPLAAHYPARPGDVGWHLLVGPERFLGSGMPRLLGRAFVSHLLNGDHPHRGRRVVCEPDIRNTRMHAFCRRLGFRSIGHLDLPEKRAVLMVHTGDDTADRHSDEPMGGERP
nr:GNAT family N-acetyltransferase [Phytoactinopolyspora alkaliphila]